jgi:hypothetical protein
MAGTVLKHFHGALALILLFREGKRILRIVAADIVKHLAISE